MSSVDEQVVRSILASHSYANTNTSMKLTQRNISLAAEEIARYFEQKFAESANCREG